MKLQIPIIFLFTQIISCSSANDTYLRSQYEGQEKSGSIDQGNSETSEKSDDVEGDKYLEDEIASTPETISGMYLTCAEDPLIENPGAQVAGCMILEEEEGKVRSEFEDFSTLDWSVNGVKYRPDCKVDSKLWSCLFYLPPNGKHSVTMTRNDLNGQSITTDVTEEVPNNVYSLWFSERKPSSGNEAGSSQKTSIPTFEASQYGELLVKENEESIRLKVVEENKDDKIKKCGYQLSETKRIESDKCEFELIGRDLAVKGKCYDDMSLSGGLGVLKGLKSQSCTEVIYQDVSIRKKDDADVISILKDEACLTLVPGLEESNSISFSKCISLDLLEVSSTQFELPPELVVDADDSDDESSD